MNTRISHGSPRTDPPKTKVCSKCKKDLPASAFYKRPFDPDGLSPMCRGCVSIQARAYRLPLLEPRLVTFLLCTIEPVRLGLPLFAVLALVLHDFWIRRFRRHNPVISVRSPAYLSALGHVILPFSLMNVTSNPRAAPRAARNDVHVATQSRVCRQFRILSIVTLVLVGERAAPARCYQGKQSDPRH